MAQWNIAEGRQDIASPPRSQVIGARVYVHCHSCTTILVETGVCDRNHPARDNVRPASFLFYGNDHTIA